MTPTLRAKAKTTTMLRLSYEEILHISVILGIGIDSATRPSTRLAVIKSAKEKIDAVLEQAEKDGLVDFSKIDSLRAEKETT